MASNASSSESGRKSQAKYSLLRGERTSIDSHGGHALEYESESDHLEPEPDDDAGSDQTLRRQRRRRRQYQTFSTSPSTSTSRSRSKSQSQQRYRRSSILSEVDPAEFATAHNAALQAAQEADAHMGVVKVEAAGKVYGKYSKWVLFGSLGLAAYMYALDACTTSAYLTFATSAFGGHGLMSTIQTTQSLIIAVGKPVIAKVADVTSRASAYLTVLIFYVLGYLTIASAQNVGTVAGGIMLYAVGYTGLQLLTQVIIADITTLRWRGLVSALISVPFLLNAFVGSKLAAAMIEGPGWRWGYGMFAILLPATLSPLIATLFWAERKAKKMGIVPEEVDEDVVGGTPFQRRLFHAKRFAEHLDLVGLMLLASSISLILLPLTLSKTVEGGLKNASIISMLVIGMILLCVFFVWDFGYATRPAIPPRFVKNHTIVIAASVGFIDFMSYYLTFTYLYAFVVVVKPWTIVEVNYFMQAQTVALTMFGIIAGVGMLYFRRYKVMLIVGLGIRTLGVGLMIHSRGANGSTAELVWTQLLQGMGGGLAAISSQVGAQASVTHADLAIVTAAVLLLTEIGGAIGSAVAGALWTNTMPENLRRFLPQLTEEERMKLYGDIPAVLAYPRGHPVREGVILAYDDTMRIMIIIALVLSCIPMFLALFLPNWYLGDTQNAVDDSDVVDEVPSDDESR